MNTVPAEVRSAVDWNSTNAIPDDRIRFAKKSDKSRGEAWNECPLPSRSKGERPHNPWRKAHSKDYWAWFCIQEVPDGRQAS